MGRRHELERLRRLWPVGPQLAGVRRYRCVASIPEAPLQARDLSNVDNESFSFSNEKLGVDFDAVYTAEDCGSYKPSARNFEYMLTKLKTLGIEKSEILHTAESLFHDHWPANEQGLASCWIHRRHGQEGAGATMALAQTPKYDFRFESLAALVKAHQEAVKA